MKKLFLLLLSCYGLCSYAQNITFEYDAAGNQIKRKFCLNCTSRTTPVKEYKDLATNDLEKFFPEDVISYYPNPVKDELYLEWELINDNKVLSIDIYNINGQLIKSFSSVVENKAVISFQEFTPGTYLVNLNYATGNQKSITIIKN